jgi:hypothetical protein
MGTRAVTVWELSLIVWIIAGLLIATKEERDNGTLV